MIGNFKKMGIRYKFFLTSFILVFIFNLIILSIWYTETSKSVENSAISYVSASLATSNNNFEVTLSGINETVSYMTVSYSNNILSSLLRIPTDSPKQYLADSNQIQNTLLDFYSFKHYLNSLTVMDIYGHNFSIGTATDPSQLESSGWYKKTLQSQNSTLIIPPHFISGSGGESGSDYGDMVITMVRPFYNSGKPAGLCTADVSCTALSDIFSNSLSDNGTVLILGKEANSLIYHGNLNNVNLSIHDLNISGLQKKFGDKSGQFTLNIADRNFLVIYKQSDFTGWTTVGLISLDKLFKASNNTFRTIIILSLFFMLLESGGIYLLSLTLTKNLLKLNKAMRNIDKDNLDISVTIRSQDETGQLYVQFNKMIARVKSLIENIKAVESQKRVLEINALQAQINPHFLYNTLNTIKFLATLQGADNIKNVSEALSKLMHINMNGQNFISVEDEAAYTQSYLEIQKYKYSNKFTATVIIDEGVGQYQIPKLILQPLVENAIIHGIAPMKSRCAVAVKIYMENDRLKLRVQDNGAGIPEEEIRRILGNHSIPGSIGLKNVMARLSLYFGDKAGVTISSEPSLYTIVELTLPLITREELNAYV
jgi:Predicted signal transduction protein with a C-terminal ATPase domain